MPALISLQDISKTHLDSPLFEGISLGVNSTDRIGIIGANGSGKTTLLQILAGLESPDRGERVAVKGLRIAYVSQDTAFDPDLTVEQIAMGANLPDSRESHEEETHLRVRAGTVLHALGFDDPNRMVRSLSGGWRRRLSIARALATDPEVLLLDEPTNHLDIEGILWLENLLVGSRFAYVIVSHDRAFLQKCATRMLELDRRYPGGHLAVEGDYCAFLEKREAQLVARARQQESLGAKVRREIEWLRSGAKARTGKSKARTDEAQRLIGDMDEMARQGVTGRAEIEFVATGRKSRRLLAAASLGQSMEGRRLFGDVHFLLRPGMRMGLVGANGSGKTTLLRLLAGELDPEQGRIARADQLRVVYFDQQREQLDPDIPLRRALTEEGDTVIYRDRPIHVSAWAARFRFRPEQLDMPVGRMSGGERAKILISRLMLQPADVLLLDEPTNDLDIPTLEVLEESLTNFAGALVMVTHDRYLLDRVSTLLLGLDGRGGAEFFADYAQWEVALLEKRPPTARKKPAAARTRVNVPTKLSYKDQREYDGMEAAIEQAEADVEQARREMEDPAVATNADRLSKCYDAHKVARDRLESLYARWYELESKHAAFQAVKERT
jgi:ABC transport system ATP-binding/permease protein